MILATENIILGKTLFVAALFARDLTWSGLGSNPGFRVENFTTVFCSTASSTTRVIISTSEQAYQNPSVTLIKGCLAVMGLLLKASKPVISHCTSTFVHCLHSDYVKL